MIDPDRLADSAHRWWLPVVLVVVAASRLLLVPGVPWEQDEALFGAAAFDTNLVEHRPHPPGFPLWTASSHLGRLVLGDPVLALQLLSAVLSVVAAWALYLLWRPVLGSWLSIAQAALFAFLPGVWFHASRAFTTMPAVALTLCAAVVWRRPGRAPLFLGAALLAAATLTRPVLAPVLLTVAVGAWVLREDPFRSKLAAAMVFVVLLVAGFAPLVADTGGVGSFLAALGAHGSGHAGALHLASWSFDGLGIVKAAGGTVPFVLLASLTVIGLATLDDRRLSLCLAAGGVITLAWLLLAHNRTYPRYSIPLLALACAPGVLGLARVTGRRVAGVITFVIALVAGLVTAPTVTAVASRPFPPLEAMQAAVEGGAATIVVDGGLSPFGDLLNLARRSPARVAWRPLIADGRIPAERLASPMAVVWSHPTPRRWVQPPLSPARRCRCTVGGVRRLSQNRYLDTWLGIGGAVILEPEHTVVSGDGSVAIGDGLTLLTSCGEDPGRLGLRLSLGEPSEVRLEAEGNTVEEGVVPAGRHTVTTRLTRPRGSKRDHLRVFRLTATPVAGRPDSARTALLDRAWLEPGPADTVPPFVPAEELVGGLDGLVSGWGLFGIENLGHPRRAGRWTTDQALISLPLSGGAVRVELVAPRPRPARVRLSVPPRGVPVDVVVGPEWTTVRVPAPTPNHRLLRIVVDNPFVPAEEMPSSRDTRELGVVIGRVVLGST